MNDLIERDICNIIINWKKDKTISRLSYCYEVSKCRIHQILFYLNGNKYTPIPHQCGRKLNKIPESEIDLVLIYHSVSQLEPVALEMLIKIDGCPNTSQSHIQELLSNNHLNQNLINRNRGNTSCLSGTVIGNNSDLKTENIG